MKMLQLLVVVVIASGVLVSPERIKEGWPTKINISPAVKIIHYQGGHRVPRRAAPVGDGWLTEVHISPAVKVIESIGTMEHAPETLGHRVPRRAEPIGEVWPKEVHISPPVKVMDSAGNVEIEYDHETLGHRVPRRANVCMIPKSMEDSKLECKIYPSRVICFQTCMFGYTLKEGIQRKMECNLDEDRWRPVNRFENCKPFVDCTLTLGPGGKFKCHSNFLEKGAHCDVSCQHFEDKPAVETKDYVCDINGNWSPELPFCARAGTGIKLTSPPNGPKIAADIQKQ